MGYQMCCSERGVYVHEQADKSHSLTRGFLEKLCMHSQKQSVELVPNLAYVNTTYKYQLGIFLKNPALNIQSH